MEAYIDETAKVIETETGEDSKIWKNTFVKNCRIGSRVNIGDFTRTEDSAFADNVSIQRNALIYSSSFGKYSYTGKNFTAWHADIGAFCSISWNVGIGGANHDYTRVTTHSFLYSPYMGLTGENEILYDRFATPCKIGNDVWIGANAVICRDVTIGDGAVVGAGAVVTKSVEPYTIVTGVPAKPIKKRFDDKTIERLLKIRWWEFDDETIRSNFELFARTPTGEVLDKLEQLRAKTDGKAEV